MLYRIYTKIAKSDFLIADMSGKNPNVFYEVGYAHALSKDVILLTNNSEEIPFELNHFQHIVYAKKNLSEMKESLDKDLQAYLPIKNKIVITNSPQLVLKDYEIGIQGQEINKDSIVEIKTETEWNELNIQFTVDFKNITGKLLKSIDNQVSLLIDKKLVSIKNNGYPCVDNYVQIDLGSIETL